MVREQLSGGQCCALQFHVPNVHLLVKLTWSNASHFRCPRMHCRAATETVLTLSMAGTSTESQGQGLSSRWRSQQLSSTACAQTAFSCVHTWDAHLHASVKLHAWERLTRSRDARVMSRRGERDSSSRDSGSCKAATACMHAQGVTALNLQVCFCDRGGSIAQMQSSGLQARPEDAVPHSMAEAQAKCTAHADAESHAPTWLPSPPRQSPSCWTF